MIIKGLHPTNRPSDAKWMFDLNTGLLSIDPRTIASPSDAGTGTFTYPNLGKGGSKVNAVVRSCGDPDDVSAGMNIQQLEQVRAYVNHLERWPPLIIDEIDKGEDVNELPEFPTFVSTVEGQNWFPSQSPRGTDLLSPSNPICAGEKTRIVRP